MLYDTGIVCSPLNFHVLIFQIKQEIQDNFEGLKLPASSLSSLTSLSSTGGLASSYISPLLETNVMVLPPSLVRKEHHAQLSTAGFIEVLDFLMTTAGFHLHGLKMVQLSLLTAGTLHAICCSDINSETKASEHTSHSLTSL